MTTIVGIVLILLLFFFGLTYYDPPKEFGIAVNFGTSNVGSGNRQPREALKPLQQEQPQQQEEVEEQQEAPEEIVEPAAEETEASSESVLTQTNEEALAIKKAEEEKKKRQAEEEAEARRKAEEARKAEEERQRIEAEKRRQEQQRREQENKRKNVDALLGGFGNTDGKADGGEGNDNQPGDKGKVTGDPNASGYYGVGGTGSGGNYRLGNRNALTKPKPEYDCNEEGRVVVSISVDQSGRVIAAQAGVKGTTNSANCLLERAREAALKTRFNADEKAPVKQVGQIIYNFSLSE